MNEIEEQRVIEALRAISGGFTVTDHDIIEAGARMQDNLHGRKPRMNRAAIAVAAAVLLVVGIATFDALRGSEKAASPEPANQPPTPAEILDAALQDDPYDLPDKEFLAGTTPTRQDLAGLWLLSLDHEGLEVDDFRPAPMYVDANGRWRIGAPTEPMGFGTSTLNGANWERALDARSRCAQNNALVGATQPTTVALASDGSLHLKLAHGEIECTLLEKREVWNRLAPGTPLTNYLYGVAWRLEWDAWDPNAAEALQGTWFDPETGHMLIVDPSGHYEYFTDLTVPTLLAKDKGTIDVASTGEFSATCQGGMFAGRLEASQTPGAGGHVPRLDAMRFLSRAGVCGSTVADENAWLKLPAGFTHSPYQD